MFYCIFREIICIIEFRISSVQVLFVYLFVRVARILHVDKLKMEKIIIQNHEKLIEFQLVNLKLL